MFCVLLAVVLFARGGGAQISDETCNTSELKICVEKTPKTPIGLPRTRNELDAHCFAYNTGMSCMEAWMKKCLPTDSQKVIQKQIGGARALMRFLCTNETALRRDYLKESKCWALISPEWSNCVNELQMAVKDITEQAQLITYFNKNFELCCARDAFISCVTYTGRSCSASASSLLRRLAWVLAQDVATCPQQPRAHCNAPSFMTAPLLTFLSGILIYPPN